MSAIYIYNNILIDISAASIITTNIEDNIVCPGEELILTCTGEGDSLRWNVQNKNSDSTEELFIRGQHLGLRRTWNSFTFTLISTDYNHFESTLSTVVTNAVNNTEVECSTSSSRDTVTIRVAGS